MVTKVNNRMIDGAAVNVLDFGAVADGVTDNWQAFTDAIESVGKVGGTVEIPVGLYAFSQQLTIHEGVALVGVGVTGSVKQKGVKLMFSSANGIVYDGNNGSSSTEGSDIYMKDIYILKAPNSDQSGWGLSFISTDSSNTPGWIYLNNVHVLGASASEGEALWGRGIVIRGAQATIGLKNLHATRCGVSGVLGDNVYLDIQNGVEMVFEDLYIRDASASFPSGGQCGITIDSDQTVGIPAENAPSALLRFSNAQILGNIILGECQSVYFANCFAVAILPTGVFGDGTTFSWFGGELTQKYVDTAGYQGKIDAVNQLSASDLSNQFRNINNITLDKSHSGIHVTNENATGIRTYTCTDVRSTNLFDWTIHNNNSTHNLVIEKNANNFFFPKGANLNSNITDLVLPPNSAVRIWSGGSASLNALNVEVLKGNIILTDVGSMNDRQEVILYRVLTGNYQNRPKEAHVFALDAGTSSRLVGVSGVGYTRGEEVVFTNVGAANDLQFGSTVIGPGETQYFRYNGTDFNE